MQRSISVQKMTAAALLIALGIVIPMFMPKISLPPASFTLASHVPIFLAMFISPAVAISVAVGTTIGFLFSGLAPIIVLRAATHLVFATAGAFYIKARPQLLASPGRTQLFSLVVGIVHAMAEVVVVTLFYFGGGVADLFYTQGFFTSVVLLVGVGSVVHSMVDFLIALAILRILAKQPMLRSMFPAVRQWQ